ncbi:MAG TPA: CHAT domain-containing protein [Nitrososphaeraceae archaeon]|nr:CHAT domain-containing protein [Nitrososphaeraceae archaeon]
MIQNDLTIKATFNDISESSTLKFEEEKKKDIEYIMNRLVDPKSKITKDEIKNIGTLLVDKLFTPNIKKHFSDAKRKATNKGLRIRLKIESFDISNYPWETLYHEGKYLAATIDTPLTRYITVNETEFKKKYGKPMKILIIGASPAAVGLPTVQVEREIQTIENVLQGEIDNGFIKLDKEPIGEARKIMSHLNNEQYNVVHFIGHGVFKDNKGYLALEDEKGGLDPADHQRIGQMFQNQKSLGLVILNACQGAVPSYENSILSTYKGFGGLAPELVKVAGVPSVIAMRYSITNQMAHDFSKIFYPNLLKRPIDEIMQIVRQNILVDSNADPREFTAPVLFMNSPDGIIFSPAETSGADDMAISPSLEVKIDQLKNYHEQLINLSEAATLKGFWMLVWNIYKENKNELDPIILKEIQKMITIVPTLFIEREEKLDEGLEEQARSLKKTIMRNFNKLMSVIPP